MATCSAVWDLACQKAAPKSGPAAPLKRPRRYEYRCIRYVAACIGYGLRGTAAGAVWGEKKESMRL